MYRKRPKFFIAHSMDETDLSKLNFSDPPLSVHAPTSANSLPVEPERSYQRTFDVRSCENGRIALASADHTISLTVSPVSYIYVSGGFVHFENLSEHPSMHVKASCIGSTVRSKIVASIADSICGQFRQEDYVDFPMFAKETQAVKRSFSLVLSGYCLFLESGNSSIISLGHYVGKLCFIDLCVPSVYSRLHSDSITLRIYADNTRLDLLAILPLGSPDNRSLVSVGLLRSRDRHLPANILSVNQHALAFRCKEECDLWSVVIDDVISCDEKRFSEIVHSRKYPEGPRGYRGHIQNLKAILLATTGAVTSQPKSDLVAASELTLLLTDAFKCISILSSKLPGVLEKDDLIRETLSKLSKRISN